MSPMANDNFDALLDRIESAVDAVPDLTRSRTGGFVEAAEICIRRQRCIARCHVRHRNARGRGARAMHEIWATGTTPESAAASLIDKLPYWTEALR